MAVFRKLWSYEDARRTIMEHIDPKPLGSERVPLLEATNRVLAQNVTADRNIPPFNRSTVDGYAVKAKDTHGAAENRPITLRLCGVVHVGEEPKTVVAQKEAATIVTGAPVPEGADAIVMVENTERIDNRVRIFSSVTRNENITMAGTDIKKGETILKEGAPLGSREIGVLAALGIEKVRVCKIPRVSVLSTGAEVTEPGKELSPGKIYDINAYSLNAAVVESGGKPVYLGVFPDDLAELQKALKLALASADIVLTSGGVSVGPKDVMPKAVASLGKPGIILSGIAIKPGKPTTIGLVEQKTVFSLPGHPTSALLVFNLLVRPVIQIMAGRSLEETEKEKAVAGARMFSAKGRKTFVMVTLKRNGSGKMIADPVEAGDSGAITTLAKADGFVEIPEDLQFVDVDEDVVVHLWGKRRVRDGH